ncbi:hypothetical protein CR513_50302, partial [Mucuna pruriens]
MCMDCHPINMITIIYRLLIPCVDNLLHEVHGPCIFSKIDLHSGYHQICMRQEDQWKTTFKTKFDNNVKHVQQVLHLVKDESLYVNLEKCTLCTQEVIFLGFMVGSKGVTPTSVRLSMLKITSNLLDEIKEKKTIHELMLWDLNYLTPYLREEDDA